MAIPYSGQNGAKKFLFRSPVRESIAGITRTDEEYRSRKRDKWWGIRWREEGKEYRGLTRTIAGIGKIDRFREIANGETKRRGKLE